MKKPRQKHFLPPGSDPRAAVRVAQFEKVLNDFNIEQGIKVAESLARYHAQIVEGRIRVIETMLGIRTARFLWNKTMELVLYVRAYFLARKALSDPNLPTSGDLAGAPAPDVPDTLPEDAISFEAAEEAREQYPQTSESLYLPNKEIEVPRPAIQIVPR